MSDIFQYRDEISEIMGIVASIMYTSRRSFTQFLAEHGEGISGLQYAVLRILERETLTSKEISKRMTLDPSTLVPVVNGLERKGFVERQRDPHDRRRIPLSLTDKARALLEQLPTISDDHVLFTAFKDFSVEELSQFLTFLRRVMVALPEGEETLCHLHERIYRKTKPHSENVP